MNFSHASWRLRKAVSMSPQDILCASEARVVTGSVVLCSSWGGSRTAPSGIFRPHLLAGCSCVVVRLGSEFIVPQVHSRVPATPIARYGREASCESVCESDSVTHLPFSCLLLEPWILLHRHWSEEPGLFVPLVRYARARISLTQKVWPSVVVKGKAAEFGSCGLWSCILTLWTVLRIAPINGLNSDGTHVLKTS